ncbi:hydrogenase maturation factor HoxX-like [Montipora foliosa]|uniref:hydrogenase maturation factor HoxX-like n=1 Tax=Montipora foliosa TaxID=591990 RepID=UPI0035F13629
MWKTSMLKDILRAPFLIPLRQRLLSQVSQAENITVQRELPKNLDILFFSNKHNSLSQRMALELEKRQQNITVQEIDNSAEMTELAEAFQPDLILCPFLTKRVPEEVFSNPRRPCWIVHPGIEGDRGASSIDWALYDREDEWGVSILQADKEMDAGDIWSTVTFPIKRRNINTLTKSSLYVNEVTQAAVQAVLEGIDKFNEGTSPKCLDYNNPLVRGIGRSRMTKADRTINWEMSADEVACQIRMSDSSPGALGYFRSKKDEEDWSKAFRLFGAHLEKGRLRFLKGHPGQILGQRHGAVLVKCGRGALWISHLKKNKLKLPATMWLDTDAPTISDASTQPIPYGSHPNTFKDIWTSITSDGVGFVHFNFYNGAMSTKQCERLVTTIKQLEENDSCRVMILMGGYDVFSNGIHLNVIEAAMDPVKESWENINAINDVVRCIFTSKKITISALRGNAGAGGVMMALASDLVFAREGIVLNPHYKKMKLYGSEYHTHFLPMRVGMEKAIELLDKAEPILSDEAADIGLLEGCVGQDVEQFETWVKNYASFLANSPVQKHFVAEKNRKASMEIMENIEACRANELNIMARNFQDPDYHQARKDFVYH